MAKYAYDAGLIQRIKPRISQWEATTGRRISPSILDALIKEQLSMESEKSSRERAYDIQQQGMDLQKQQAADAKSAAKVSGITGTIGTAANIGLTYKALSRPSALEEMTLYNNSVKNNTAQQNLYDTGWPNTATGSPGAQTSLAGGTPATGAQVQPAYTPPPASDAASLAAYDASMAEGAAEGVGSTAGTEASGVAFGGAGGAYGTGAGIAAGTAAGLATQYAVTKTGEGKAFNARTADLSKNLGMTSWSDKEYASKGSATVSGLAGGGAWGAVVSNVIWDAGKAFQTGKISNELLGIPFADKVFNTDLGSIFGW